MPPPRRTPLVLVVAGRDLRAQLRDRSTLVLAFVAPVVLTLIVSLVLGGEPRFTATYVVVDHDGGELATAFQREVLGAPELADSVTVRTAPTAAAARRLVSDDEAAAAFIIPEDFSEALTAGDRSRLEVVRSSRSPVGADVAVALAEGFESRVAAVGLSVALVAAGTDDRPSGAVLAALVAEAASVPAAIELASEVAGTREVPMASHLGPAMAVFFLYFTVALGVRNLLRERQDGTLARSLAAPVRRSTVLAGKGLSMLVLAGLTVGTMALVTNVAFGASWGDPVAVVVLIIALVFSVMGFALVIGTLARTEEQVQGYAAALAFGLALLGGNFVPPGALPDGLQRVGQLTPNGWTLDAFRTLATDGGGLATVAPAVWRLLALTLVLVLVVRLRTRRLDLR